MTPDARTVLLGGIRAPLASLLETALAEAGLQPVTLRADPGNVAGITDELAGLDTAPHAFINHAALLLELPGRGYAAYPPLACHRAVIDHLAPGSSLVHLFGDMTPAPDPRALTLPLVRRLMADLDEPAGNRGLRMNAVSLRHVPGVDEAERARILQARIRTIVWLAGQADDRPDRQVLRGYASDERPA